MFAVWIWQLNNSAGDGKSGEIEEKSLLKCYTVILNSFLSFFFGW